MKYYIFLDLDGSVLNRQGEISEKTKKRLQKLEADGHQLIITTGRPFSGAERFYWDLNLKSPIISDNGAFIHNPTDNTFPKIRLEMTKKDFHGHFRLVKDILESALYNVGDKVYTYKKDPSLEWLYHGASGDNVIEEDYNNLNVLPTGIIYTVHANNHIFFENIIEKHFPKLGYRVWGVRKNIFLYEVFVKGNTKGNAIKFLIKILNIDPRYTIAFGDDLNDFDMLQTVQYGVAMLNARNGLEQSTKYQTYKTNDEDGIIDYLEKMFNLK